MAIKILYNPIEKVISGYSKIGTAIKKNKLIENVARQNTKKKYPTGGREGMQEMYTKELKRLRKSTKRK